MKSLLKITSLFLLLLVNLFANTREEIYLVRVEINERNLSPLLNKYEIPVVYKMDQDFLLKINQDQVKLLDRSGLDYTVLDQNISANSYHLINIKDFEAIDHYQFHSIGKCGDYLILKNIKQDHLRDLSRKTRISPLHLSLNQSFIDKYYTTQQSGTDIEPLITDLIEDIDLDSIEYIINMLQHYGTRFMLAPNRFEVSQWIFDKFMSYGFTDVEFDTFTAYTSINYYPVYEDTVTLQRNVVATLPGSGDPEAVFIVCGHYDSFNSTFDPFQYAPGADDDASGTAAVLEMARVFMENGIIPRRTIKFIALGAEELMYFGDGGSEHYAALADSLDMDIRMVINHDMISHTTQTLTNSTILVNHHFTADHFADLAIENIDTYTQANGYLSDYYGADLGPFIQHGYTGIFFEESEFSPFYHTSDDVIENYSMEFCTEVIKASCATLIQCATIPTTLEDFTIADRSEGTSLLLSWESNKDYNFDHYKIYIGEESGVYTREETTEDTSHVIDQLVSGTEYYIGVSVVDSDGYESLLNEQSYIPFYFSLDEGILVIDETADGDGSLSKPTDEQVDQFYESLLSRFNKSHWDLIDHQGISLTDFGSYSTIIWQADDFSNLMTLDSILNELGRFLNAGGNLLYTGYLPCQAIEGIFEYPDSFETGDFVYDYLKIAATNNGFGTRFSGAKSKSAEYFDIDVDTIKTAHIPTLHLSNIESIEPTDRGVPILFYDSDYDSLSAQGRMIGEPVGVEYIGEDYKVVTLTFPLYFMEENRSKELLEHILNVKFSEPVTIAASKTQIPESFALDQNYPNPFNPTTIINYQLSTSNDVELSIFNTLGQKIVTLVSEYQQAGSHSVTWDGSDMASGVYYYILTSGDFQDVKKMVLLR